MGNKIVDCSIGLVIYSNDTQVIENEFLQSYARGIQFESVKNVTISKNIIRSTRPGSCGIQQENSPLNPEYYFADNFNITENTIDVSGGIDAHGIFINATNSASAYENYRVNITKNKVTASGKFQLGGVNGFNVDDNKLYSKMGMWIIASARRVLIQHNRIETDPRDNPVNTVNYTLVSAIYVNDCTSPDNVIKQNEIYNLSTNNNTHIMQIKSTTNLVVSENKVYQKVSKIFDVVAPSANITTCKDLTFIRNGGDIGTCTQAPFLIYASDCPGIVATDNVAGIAPFTRQYINGAGPWGCP